MRLKFAILAVVVLLSGCLGKEQAAVTKYVCADGSVVLNPRECMMVEKPATVKVYVCPDGSTVSDPDDCRKCGNGVCDPDEQGLICPEDCCVAYCGDGNCTRQTRTCMNFNETPESCPEDCKETAADAAGTVAPITPPASTTVEPSTTLETSTIEEVSEAENACISLGCDADTAYVGSKNSDKYHPCDCRYAKRINLENIVCFSSADDAAERGYTPSTGC